MDGIQSRIERMPLPKDHPNESCPTCPYHNTEIYRMDLAEKSIISINSCIKEMKKDMSGLEKSVSKEIAKIETGQLLLKQRLSNLMWPILIILGAVLAELAKNIVPLLASLGAS